MSKIYVKQDGLYRDGKKLQLIFGDPEQVAAIRRYERRVAQFIEGYAEPSQINYTVQATMFFTCICDNHLFERTVDADEEDDESCFSQEKFLCPKCEARYETRYEYQTDSVKIQLKPFIKKNV